MAQTYAELFMKGCEHYIEGDYQLALEAFDAARRVNPNLTLDMWRARTIMDTGDHLRGIQLLLWMLAEYKADVKIHKMLALVQLELTPAQLHNEVTRQGFAFSD